MLVKRRSAPRWLELLSEAPTHALPHEVMPSDGDSGAPVKIKLDLGDVYVRESDFETPQPIEVPKDRVPLLSSIQFSIARRQLGISRWTNPAAI